MLSMVPVMSAMRRLLAVMSSMVAAMRPTTCPPSAATALAAWASCAAALAVSAVLFTVALSSSIEATVCCRLEACSSVRCDRSALPVAISAEPVAMESLLVRT